MTDLYQEMILEEFRHPQNCGVIEQADATIEEKHLSCGDQIQIFLKLDEKRKIVQDLKWQGQGCAISVAAMSVLSQTVKGKKISTIQRMTKDDVLALLGMTQISYGRENCLMLGLRAIQKYFSGQNQDIQA